MAFAPQNFVDKVGPPISAAWLNGLDVAVNETLGGATSVSQVQGTLGIAALVASIVTQAYVQAFVPQAYVEGFINQAYVESLITSGYITEIVNPITTAESMEGVTVTNFLYVAGRPERYQVGAITYAATDGSSGTDFTTAINTAANIPGQACILGPFQYLFGATPGSNLVVNGGANIRGDARWNSSLIASNAATGVLIQDTSGNGGAAKLVLSNFTVYGNNATGGVRITKGMYLGYNDASAPYGTESILDNVTMRDLQCPAYYIKCNVGEIGFIQDLNTAGSLIIGTATTIGRMEIVGAAGFATDSQNCVLVLGDVTVDFLEIEAPGTATFLIYFQGNANVKQAYHSFAGGTIHPNEVLIGANCNSGKLTVLHYFTQGAAWASGNTYGVGPVVSYAGQLYSSLQAANVGNQPNTSPTWWQLSPTISNGLFNDSSLASPNWGPNSTGGLHYADGSYDLYRGGNAGRQIVGGLTIGQTGTQVNYKLAGTLAFSAETTNALSFATQLPGTPRVASIVPHGNCGNFWAVATATGLTINCSATFTGTFDWSVEL